MQMRENHVICVLKITLYLYALNIRAPNQHILRHEKVSYFELHVSALFSANFGLNFLYMPLSCNHSNQKATRIDKMFSENCVEGLYAANKAILYLESVSGFNQMKSFLRNINTCM